MTPTLNTRPARVENAIQAACDRLGINRSDLLLGNRRRPYQDARRAICQELRDGDYTLPTIGHMLNVHHSTVQYYLKEETGELKKLRVENARLRAQLAVSEKAKGAAA